MSQSVIWQRFGNAISTQGRETLRAFLGDRESEDRLRIRSIPFPTIEDFRRDPVFDPNPQRLALPQELLETELLVRSLAVWGPNVLIRAAFACAVTQMTYQAVCPPDLVALRDAAYNAVQEFIRSETPENRRNAILASRRCAKHYHEHSTDPRAV